MRELCQEEKTGMAWKHLFSPFQIGGLRLENRLIMSPMTMNYATEEGYATEKLIRYYAERARGGVGLIVVEGTYFRQEGKGYVRQLGIASPEHAARLRPLTGAIHEQGTPLFLQIHHAGWRASSRVTGKPPVGPSALAPYPGAETAQALSPEEIEELIRAHVQAAVWAREAGFDGVDLHAAHGYLIPSFLSPLANRRTDAYGGDLKARCLFLLRIIEGIRRRLGPEYPLTLKVSGDEYLQGGLGLEDMIGVARLAQEAGIDALTVSAGSVGGAKTGDLTEPHKVLRTLPMMTAPGCLVPLAARMKEALRIPVIAVGRIQDAALADTILARGQADLVAMGRALLADPHLPRKSREGRQEDVRPCIACNEGCYKRIFQQKEILCSVNPHLGREGEQVSRAERPLRVVVVGGGPAGLEAAHAAWKRGHRVTVIEAQKDLGGQLLLASKPPGREDIGRFREYLLRRLDQTDIKIVTGVRASASRILRERPQRIILASGALPQVAVIAGLDPVKAVTAWEVLAEEKRGEPPFLVLGGGLVGCDAADFLSSRGQAVVLVEMLEKLAAEADGDTRNWFDLRFSRGGVRVYSGATVERISGSKAWIRRGADEVQEPFGTLVFAVGARANDDLAQDLGTAGSEVVRIGDAAAPRNLLAAVHEGFQAGRTP